MVEFSWIQFYFFFFEIVVYSGLLIFLFEQRERFGLGLLFTAVGSFQYLQYVLAFSIYGELFPGVIVSPGSVVFFTGSLFAILLVYIREDAIQARPLIWGIFIANISIGLFSYLISWQVQLPQMFNFSELPVLLFRQSIKGFTIGTIAVFFDVIGLIIVFEYLSKMRLFERWFWGRTTVTLIIVLTFDTIIFISGMFWSAENYYPLLWSGIIGKSFSAIVYSSILSIYFYWVSKAKKSGGRKMMSLQPDIDLLGILTYRQKYAQLKELTFIDALTKTYNRRFLTQILPEKIEELPENLTVFMLDLDNFKNVNDSYGHQLGDECLYYFAHSLKSFLREKDILCRYGGDEFTIIMPDVDQQVASAIEDRIKKEINLSLDRYVSGHLPNLQSKLSVSIGFASYPIDGVNSKDLLFVADQRLYLSKNKDRKEVNYFIDKIKNDLNR